MKRLLKRWRAKRNRMRFRRHRLQNVTPDQTLNLVTLGSDYGGWTFHDGGNLHNATIISAGLGEDASFDVEFAAKYDARVVIVDPTPRAVSHFAELQQHIGSPREHPYVDGGCQPLAAYPLDLVSSGQLVLEASALWSEPALLHKSCEGFIM